MHKALENLRQIRKGDDELEESYRKRLNKAIHRCGNVHEDDEEMTMYIEGILKDIQTIFAHHQESVPGRDLNHEDLIHFAPSEDEAVRSKERQTRHFTRLT